MFEQNQLAHRILEAAEWTEKTLTDLGFLADYSLQSVNELESRFDEIASCDTVAGKPEDEIVFALGSYIGQAFIKLIGGFWVLDKDTTANSYVLLSAKTCVFPFSACQNWLNGEEDSSLYEYFNEIYSEAKETVAEKIAAIERKNSSVLFRLKYKVSFIDAFKFEIAGWGIKTLGVYFLSIAAVFAVFFFAGRGEKPSNELIFSSLAKAALFGILEAIATLLLKFNRAKKAFRNIGDFENEIVFTESHIILDTPVALRVFGNDEVQRARLLRNYMAFSFVGGEFFFVPVNDKNKSDVSAVWEYVRVSILENIQQSAPPKNKRQEKSEILLLIEIILTFGILFLIAVVAEKYFSVITFSFNFPGAVVAIFGILLWFGIYRLLHKFLSRTLAFWLEDEESSLFDVFKKNRLYLYSEKELEEYDDYIKEMFGDCYTVYHEIVSQDIHLDVMIFPPNEKRDCYALVTTGAGAYKMQVPREYKKYEMSNAEYVIFLPKDWQGNVNDEESIWQVQMLRNVARIPVNNKTWLGYGHTVHGNKDMSPFAKSTKLNSSVLLLTEDTDGNYYSVRLSCGKKIILYTVLPLYQEELEFKFENGLDELLARFPKENLALIDPARPNYCAPEE